MQVEELIDRFASQTPVAMMVRATLSRVLSAERLDAIFSHHRVRQKCGDLLFSTVVDLMAMVAIKTKPSVNAAYRHRLESVNVSVTSIYNKLQGIETSVSRAVVKITAEDLYGVLRSMRAGLPEPMLPGYRIRIVDGNHLAGTEHRIKELRGLGAAALPGQAMVVLDPDYRLISDVIPCTDGHAGETSLIPQILECVQRKEVWVADRGLGSKAMMTVIALDKQAFFVFRHSNALLQKWSAIGQMRKIKQTSTETIYEQAIEFDYMGRTLTLRRITVKLAKPTRYGEKEIHILTNLPKRVGAKTVVQAYRHRWKIETAFQQLEKSLNSEIETLGYPEAALFSFCIGLLMFNVLSTIKTAIAAAHEQPDLADEISTYYVALEASGAWQTLTAVISDEEFAPTYAKLTLAGLGKKLVAMAKHVNFEQVRKSHRGPKQPPAKKISGNRGNHVATSRILLNRT